MATNKDELKEISIDTKQIIEDMKKDIESKSKNISGFFFQQTPIVENELEHLEFNSIDYLIQQTGRKKTISFFTEQDPC